MNNTPRLSIEKNRRLFQKCTKRDNCAFINYDKLYINGVEYRPPPWCTFLNLETRNLICASLPPLLETRTIGQASSRSDWLKCTKVYKAESYYFRNKMYLFKCLWYQVKTFTTWIYTVNYNTWYMYIYRDKNWQIWHFKYPRWF
jgi:hypothetical protein